jgi:hypothetical protein
MTVARTAVRLAAALILLAACGCSRTLVFAEREGVNLSIRADAARTPPLEVNFGFNRVVGTTVPPAAEEGQGPNAQPRGQAVNMFSGFRVMSAGINTAMPLNVDMQISTQFASGAAAIAIADNPAAVAALVSLSDGPVTTTRSDLRPLVRAASDTLATFTPTQRRRAASILGVPGLVTLSDTRVNDTLSDMVDRARNDPAALNRFIAALAQVRGP